MTDFVDPDAKPGFIDPDSLKNVRLNSGQVDTSEGAGFMPRLKASFISKPEDKVNYYKSVFGDENVQTKDGDVTWRHPGDKKWHPIDEKGLSWADLADFAGDVAPVLGMGVGGVLGAAGGLPGAVAGAAAGAGAGQLANETIASMLPGATATPLEKAGEVGKQALFGGASEGVLGLAKKITPKELINKWIANQIKKEGETNFAKESVRLQDATGIKLRASQETMNPDVALMEGFSERNPFGKTIFKKADIANQTAAQARLERLIGASGGQLDKPGMGQSIADTAGKVMDGLMDNRNKVGENFKLLDTAAGGKPMFDLGNFREYLKTEGEKMVSDGMSNTAKEYGARLLKSANQFDGPASARGLQDALAQYGDIAYGKAGKSLFRDLDSAADRRVAGGAYKALIKDLDITANQAGPNGIGKLLKDTRNNYKAASESIDAFQSTLIGKFLDAQGAKNYTDVAEWVVKQNPEAIRNTLKVLGKANPELQNDVVRSVLSDSLKAGMVDRPVPFDRELALKALPKDLEIRKALFENHVSENEIIDLFKVIERSTWKPQGQGIPQSPLHTLLNITTRAAAGNLAPAVTAVLAPRIIAQWATDPAQRVAFKAALMGTEATKERAMRFLISDLKTQIPQMMAYEAQKSANDATKRPQ